MKRVTSGDYGDQGNNNDDDGGYVNGDGSSDDGYGYGSGDDGYGGGSGDDDHGYGSDDDFGYGSDDGYGYGNDNDGNDSGNRYGHSSYETGNGASGHKTPPSDPTPGRDYASKPCTLANGVHGRRYKASWTGPRPDDVVEAAAAIQSAWRKLGVQTTNNSDYDDAGYYVRILAHPAGLAEPAPNDYRVALAISEREGALLVVETRCIATQAR